MLFFTWHFSPRGDFGSLYILTYVPGIQKYSFFFKWEINHLFPWIKILNKILWSYSDRNRKILLVFFMSFLGLAICWFLVCN